MGGQAQPPYPLSVWWHYLLRNMKFPREGFGVQSPAVSSTWWDCWLPGCRLEMQGVEGAIQERWLPVVLSEDSPAPCCSGRPPGCWKPWGQAEL